MKKIFAYFGLASLIFVSVGKIAIAQQYNPAVAILLPDVSTADKSMKMLLDSVSLIAKERLPQMIGENAPENVKRSVANIFKNPESFSIDRIYAFETLGALYGAFAEGVHQDSMLVFIMAQKTTQEIDALRQIAEQEKVKYIVGFSEVHYSLVEGEVKVRIKAFLYDYTKGEILYHREYNNESKFEKNTKEDALRQLQLAMRQVVFQFGREVFQTILPTVPNYKKPQDVEQEREKYLLKNIHEKEPNTEIEAILKKEMAQIERDDDSFYPKNDTLHYYQGFFDETKQKLIAFIWKSPKNVLSLTEGNIQQIRFEIVAGIFHKGRWYLDVATYPSARGYTSFNTAKYDLETAKKLYITNLIIYNFFKKKSAEPNSDFWENGFFGKVQTDFSKKIKGSEDEIENYQKGRVKSDMPINVHKEVKKQKIWIKRYKEREKEYAPYKGMYRIVLQDSLDKNIDHGGSFSHSGSSGGVWGMDSIRDASKEAILKQQKSEVINTPMYIRGKNDRQWIEAQVLRDKKGNETLHFFLYDAQEMKVYEWLYFKPQTLNPKPKKEDGYEKKRIYEDYLEEIIDKKMMKLTDWLDAEYPIEDDKFWQEYVFKQKKGKAMYLKQILPAKK